MTRDCIDELADKLWRVHPKEIQDSGLTRAQWYAREIRAALEPSDDFHVCKACSGTGLEGGARYDDALELGFKLLNAVRVISLQSGEPVEQLVESLSGGALLKAMAAYRADLTHPSTPLAVPHSRGERQMNEEISKMTECPKCGLEFKALLHSLCIHNECPVRDYTRRPIAELAEEGMRQGRAISTSPRVWEYEGADGAWHQCRNADDACMWAEDGRRIREKTA